MSDYTDYDGTPPHVRGSDTSRSAAVDIAASVTELQQRVFAQLQLGPATDDEMQLALGMNPSTQRPRRVELVDRGLVCGSPQRRETRTGKYAVVWQVHAETGCSCGNAQPVVKPPKPTRAEMAALLEFMRGMLREHKVTPPPEVVRSCLWLRDHYKP